MSVALVGGLASGFGCARPSDAPGDVVPAGPSMRPAVSRGQPARSAPAGPSASNAATTADVPGDAETPRYAEETLREAMLDDGDEARRAALESIWRERSATRTRDLVALRWKNEPTLLPIALELYDAHRIIVGTEPAQLMDGGFRGRLHLVPEAPIGPYAKHLAWVRDAHRDYDQVFAAIRAREPAIATRRLSTRGIVYGFFRSVGRTTPSAYASGWRIAYNVSGSLHGSALAVEDTLFHEIFHLNDEADKWAGGHLRAIHASILERCNGELPSACLAPYAPTSTIVRGGTYYAFQPDNGDAVDEYGAEIATRWFQEHRALVLAQPPPKGSPFKCRTPENERAWKLVADAFFAGVDLVPACSSTQGGAP